VHEQGKVEGGGGLPHGIERLIVEVASVHARPDLDAPEPEAGRPFQFPDGGVGGLQGRDGRAQEPRGPRRHHGPDGVGVEPAELCGRRGFGPVAEHQGRRGEHLPIDPEPVEVLDADGRVEHLLGETAVSHGPAQQRTTASVLLNNARPPVVGVAGQELVPAPGEDVRVHVDDTHGLLGWVEARAESLGAANPASGAVRSSAVTALSRGTAV
jgi:hypothetical protein